MCASWGGALGEPRHRRQHFGNISIVPGVSRLPSPQTITSAGTRHHAKPLLGVDSVSVSFGGVRALDHVTCDVFPGEICGLIGPNGAGKTTLFNCITRIYPLASGSISYAGERIDHLAPRRVIARGIARTFQNLGVYATMTVLENVLLGAHHRIASGFVATVARPWTTDAEEARLVEQCRSLLRELELESFANDLAGSLPFGTLKRVEIARALASRPRLLLLDEPASGLTYRELVDFGALISRIRDLFDLTVLLVEHNMGLVMDLCSRVLVLHLGRKLAEGTPAQIQSDPAVVAAYLGDAD
ncbi:MAG: high-affinity branched-chain amino acid ABC transporter ATP-binding protein LivG [Proteobacteria bacterium]|nr:MAG: high-affinity branched-chain amino acid ABC transporter ATP-binding protein LivG [Pseudomonadota bacterium]